MALVESTARGTTEVAVEEKCVKDTVGADRDPN